MSPSYRIVFYISGHGFGHTSRGVALIEALVRDDPGVEVTVKTSAPRALYENTLGTRIDLVELQCDTGMVQIDSLAIDAAASVRQAAAFQRGLPALAAREADDLRARGADVVVGDIPPLAFAAAAAAGVPSVALGNFTWDWIYQAYDQPGALPLSEDVRRIYRHADVALRLPMAGGFAGLDPIVRDIPFIARRSARTRDEVRQMLGLPPRAHGAPLVLISFGGYGVAGMDTTAVAALDGYTVATTDIPAGGHAIKPAPGLLYVSERQLGARGLRYEDLVRGADAVVTKPGYGIISDAIANETALLYTSRGAFPEYEVLVKEMPRYLRARFIDRASLLRGDWGAALGELLSQPAPPETPALNGAEIAAAEIRRVAARARR